MANDAGGRGGGKNKPRRPTANTSGQRPQPHAGAGRYNPFASLDPSQVHVARKRRPPK